MELLGNISAAGISAVATVSLIHPIDVVKTRLQVSSSNKSMGINGTIKSIFVNEGMGAFWKGIQAAWIREATYTSLRLGLYSPINRAIDPNNKYGFAGKFTSGSIAGAIGSIVGNPFDVVKTRLMASKQKNIIPLRNIFENIYLTEGLDGFYRGLSANVMRACVLNGTKMACYDQIKEQIVHQGFDKSSILTQFISAFGAGFFMAITVTPFDMVRTQMMNGNSSGFVNSVKTIISTRGPIGLYAGFLPIWIRFAPTTTFQLVIFEQIKPVFGLK